MYPLKQNYTRDYTEHTNETTVQLSENSNVVFL